MRSGREAGKLPEATGHLDRTIGLATKYAVLNALDQFGQTQSCFAWT